MRSQSEDALSFLPFKCCALCSFLSARTVTADDFRVFDIGSRGVGRVKVSAFDIDFPYRFLLVLWFLFPSASAWFVLFLSSAQNWAVARCSLLAAH